MKHLFTQLPEVLFNLTEDLFIRGLTLTVKHVLKLEVYNFYI